MNKLFSFPSFLILVFFIGAVTGGWTVATITDRASGADVFARSASEIGTLVGALQSLRKSNGQEAIDILEMQLDYHLVDLNEVAKTPAPKRDPRIVQALTVAKSYRARHPRVTPHPTIDDAVNRALESVP